MPEPRVIRLSSSSSGLERCDVCDRPLAADAEGLFTCECGTAYEVRSVVRDEPEPDEPS